MAWKAIADNKIRCYWKCPNSECKINNEAIVTPDWYQNNETPVCGDCGEDMEYSYTEIDTCYIEKYLLYRKKRLKSKSFQKNSNIFLEII